MNLQDQIKQVQQNKALAQQLMNSPDGQKLLQLLTQDGGAQLKNATDAAAKGNTADIVRMIAQVMKSEEGAQIVQNINHQLK